MNKTILHPNQAGKSLRFVLVALIGVLATTAFLTGSPSSAAAQSGYDLARTIASADSKSDVQGLTTYIRRDFPAEVDLADALAGYLTGGTRWFDRNGTHGDAIDNVGTNSALVGFTYRRNGKRPGTSLLTAHRIGDGLVVLAGEWWQTSKMRGGSTTTPPIPLPNGMVIPPITIPWGMAYSDDWGGAIYVFEETSTGFRSVTGTGMDFGDSTPNPNWLTGGSGQ